MSASPSCMSCRPAVRPLTGLWSAHYPHTPLLSQLAHLTSRSHYAPFVFIVDVADPVCLAAGRGGGSLWVACDLRSTCGRSSHRPASCMSFRAVSCVSAPRQQVRAIVACLPRARSTRIHVQNSFPWSSWAAANGFLKRCGTEHFLL